MDAMYLNLMFINPRPPVGADAKGARSTRPSLTPPCKKSWIRACITLYPIGESVVRSSERYAMCNRLYLSLNKVCIAVITSWISLQQWFITFATFKKHEYITMIDRTCRQAPSSPRPIPGKQKKRNRGGGGGGGSPTFFDAERIVAYLCLEIVFLRGT